MSTAWTWTNCWRRSMSSSAPKAPVLDARLAAAAAWVRPGGVAADIGCDHGKLAVYLAVTGVCRRVVAADLRPGPLARAAALCEGYGCAGRVDCRLGDGLAALAPDEAQDIVIAGVSGVTAAEMLRCAPFLIRPGTRFIFVPPTKHGALRDYLWRGGFPLIGEQPVLAAGRVYTVLCAEYTGEKRVPSLFDCAVGLTPKTGAAARAYLAHTALLAEKYARGAQEKETYLELAAQVRTAAEEVR